MEKYITTNYLLSGAPFLKTLTLIAIAIDASRGENSLLS